MLRFSLTAGLSALSGERFMNCLWELTYRCTARCGMCGYWRSPSEREQELNLPEIQAGLAKIRDYGCRMVNFTGGEPTLRADLEEIVATASSLGLWTSVTTNGSLLTRQRLLRLKDAGLDSLMVSLDSPSPELHDAQRGVPGSHGVVLNCLRLLAEEFVEGHRIGGFMTVLSAENAGCIQDLGTLAERLGVFFIVQPYHARKTGPSSYIFPVDAATTRQLLEMKRSSNALLNSASYLRRWPVEGAPSSGPGCQAGRKYFSVDPGGYLHPCVDLPAVGHVLRDEISVVGRAGGLEAVGMCAGCWYCFRGEADATTSLSGCFEKAVLGCRVLLRNASNKRRRRVSGRSLTGALGSRGS